MFRSPGQPRPFQVVSIDLDGDGYRDCQVDCPDATLAVTGPPVDLDGDGILDCSPCPVGGQLAAGDHTKCFVVHVNTVGWDTASSYCAGEGGVLARIDSQAQLTQVTDMAADINVFGFWIGGRKKEGWVWDDGTLVAGDGKFDGWKPGQPENDGYMLIEWGEWHDSYQHHTLNRACEIPLTGYDKCQDGWHERGEQCLRQSSTTATWSAARDACYAMNTTLVSVHSLQEFLWVELLGNEETV